MPPRPALRRWLTAVTLAGSAGRLAAQGPAPGAAPLPPSTRVRIQAPVFGTATVVRRVWQQRGDTLVLTADRPGTLDTASVTLRDVTRLEVGRGWRRRALVGGLVGLGAGAAAGAAIGAAQYTPPRSGCRDGLFGCGNLLTRGEQVTLAGLTGASYGMVAGALFGRFVLGERWQQVRPLTTRVGAGATGLGLHVSFR